MIDHTGGGAGKGCSCCYRYAGCCRRKRPRNEQKVASNSVTSMSDKMNMVQETPTKVSISLNINTQNSSFHCYTHIFNSFEILTMLVYTRMTIRIRVCKK